MYIKTTNASDKRCANSSLKMHPKRLAGGRPVGEAFSAPQTLYLDLKGRDRDKGMGWWGTGGRVKNRKVWGNLPAPIMSKSPRHALSKPR